MSVETPLLPSGGYENLRSYKIATAVYDATVVFCDRFIAKGSRTHDQMVQAARSGVRNISEGSGAAATSRKTELKLTNVARASLKDELIQDYASFLSQHGLRVWAKDSPEALALREQLRHDDFLNGLALFVAKAEPEEAANALICATHQATYLLRRQLESQGREFLERGGFTERLHDARVATRESQKSDRSDESDQSDVSARAPKCPLCAKPMHRRTAHSGLHNGQPFWGCSGYPECRGLLPIQNEPDRSDRSDLSDS